MKILPEKLLPTIRQNNVDKTIVHCHGVYDLLHYGHLLHLNSAKALGDILVVSITADQYVNKGPHRPHNPAEKRAAMLAALEMVDHVFINDAPTAIPAIKAIQPHFYVKGEEYKDKGKDITGGIYSEEAAVNAHGGSLVFTADETDSSTRLLNTFFSAWSDNQQRTIDTLNARFSIAQIEQTIQKTQGLKVLVIGEPIIDTYIFCNPLALSSKSPSVSAEFIREENYTGGTIAIAKHLAALGCQVSLLMPHGNEPLTQSLISGVKEERHLTLYEYVTQAATPRKTRYIQPFKSQRLFEITNINNADWMRQDMTDYITLQNRLAAANDLTIAADFGHGLFEGAVLEAVAKLPSKLALNVQTNSSNFGFNVFKKHKRFDYLCIDEKELRLGMHSRYKEVVHLAQEALHEHKMEVFTTTLGAQGSLTVWGSGEKDWLVTPTFFSETVDTTGAGDAYFAITAVLNHLAADVHLTSFLGNIYAGLKAQIIGNKSAVNTVDFIRTIKSILT